MSQKKAPFNTNMFAQISAAVKDVNQRAKDSVSLTSKMIRLTDITVGENVRKHFDDQALNELADSIKSVGQQTPITVREDREHPGKWIIVTGERRFRAMQKLGMEQIKAIVDDGTQIRAKQLVENIQREDMNILDIGLALHKFLDEEKLTQEAVGKLIGKNRRFVIRALSVTALPSEIQELCVQNVIRDATATETLSKLFNENPDWTQWLIDEIMAIVRTGKFDPDEDAEVSETESIAANVCITRAIVNELRNKLIKKQKSDSKDHSDDLPLSPSVPLTLANAARLRRTKQYKNYHFNGLNVRMTCLFTDPEQYGDEHLGYDEDPMKCAQLTTISTDDPSIGIVEYQNQLLEIPLTNILITGMVRLSNKGEIRPTKSKKE